MSFLLRRAATGVAAVAPLSLLLSTGASAPAHAVDPTFGIGGVIVRTAAGYAINCHATWANVLYENILVTSTGVDDCYMRGGIEAPPVGNYGSVATTSMAGLGAPPSSTLCMRATFDWVETPLAVPPIGSTGTHDTGLVCKEVLVVRG